MELAGAARRSGGARERRERRRRQEARIRLSLVRDGAALAGHRGGPEPALRVDGGLEALRQELSQLRAALQLAQDRIEALEATNTQPGEPEKEEYAVAADGEADLGVEAEQLARDQAQLHEGKTVLIVEDQQGVKTPYKFKKSTPLHKLKSFHCKRMGLLEAQVQFSAGKKAILGGGTAEELGLKDGDCIMVTEVAGTTSMGRQKLAKGPRSSGWSSGG